MQAYQTDIGKEPPVRKSTGSDEFELAEQFALHTNQPVFLTGKAGSGKTTLLRKIAEKTTKNFVIVAPTGVAAINAGGVTIHSQFQLPIKSFIPSNDDVDINIAVNRRLLVSHFRFNRDKRRVLEELELLIIDEVSMVRCDILDAVDFALQLVRRNKEPFGGVQVLLIGDMHQLPPVIRDHEWTILKKYYEGPYFFNSLVWNKLNAVQVELKKIFRQRDEKFLQLLNNIRNNVLEESDFELLEKRYKPGFKPAEPGYVLLSTHNIKADRVNEYELSRLPGKQFTYDADIKGEFPENMYPCDPHMKLRVGAQVMFVRNDVEDGKYFNGKLATVTALENSSVTVEFQDSKESYRLKMERWENVRYSIEKDTHRVIKEELGSFSQYPLRLAWAITIHKSQGLTFDKLIIDAGQSFAAGQVYVALSRCRTLEGLVLHSRIHQDVLFHDEKINSFSGSHHQSPELQAILGEAKERYAREQLHKLFDFGKLLSALVEWKDLAEGRDLQDEDSILELIGKVKNDLEKIVTTSSKFQIQLGDLLIRDLDVPVIKERCDKAIAYFTGAIHAAALVPVQEHITAFKQKARMKTYTRQLQVVENIFRLTLSRLYNATFAGEKLFTGEPIRVTATDPVKPKTKKQKGETFLETLHLHRQNKTVDEIAAIRGLVSGTIKSHLEQLVRKGHLDVHALLPESMYREIKAEIQKNPDLGVTEIRHRMGVKYDFHEIRMVLYSLHPEDKK